MLITLNLRSLVAFAAGLALALIGVVVFQAWRADVAAGDVDLTFIPITPCRLVDTRSGVDHIGALTTFGPDQTQVARIPDGHVPTRRQHCLADGG